MLIGLRSLLSPHRAGLLLAALLLTGCENRETRVYRVPKPLAAPQVEPPAGHAGAQQSPAHPRRPHVHWQLPQGWEELPPSEMRLGDFRVHGEDGRAEVTIIPLAGRAGSDLDNVNRWRGQVGLEPITEGQLAGTSEPVEIADQSSRLYDMAGVSGDDEKTRILVTILRRGETSWFFKMIGADALVQRETATFKSFLKAVSFHDAAKSPAVVESVPNSAPQAPKPSWKVPADWRELPPGQMQTAKFALADNAEVTVAAFPGDVGGLLANVNRWREQLGRPPVDTAELPRVTTRLDAGGTAATLVDITAENKQRRMIAIILPRGEETWFFKLLGDEPAVAGAKNIFVNFVKSAE